MASVVTLIDYHLHKFIIINIKSYNRKGSTTGAGNDVHQMKEEFGSRPEGVTVGMGGSGGLELERGARGMVGDHESTSKICAKGIERPKNLLNMN